MYLVIGANGFLGTYIIKNILEKTKSRIVAVARTIDLLPQNERVEWIPCDISSRESVNDLVEYLKAFQEVNVIFLAAYHNPDLVEKNPRLAWDINITSLSYVLNRLENVRCLFYPSTDSVYGNSIEGYHFKEEDPLCPVNIYGRQKVTAEAVVCGYGYNVVRYPFLLSPSLLSSKKHFYDIIKETLLSGNRIEMFEDSLRSSMSFDQAADFLIQLIEQYSESLPKQLNICGDEDLSKYDVGLRIADRLGVDRSLVVPVSVGAANRIFTANRAVSTLMDNTKLKSLLKIDKITLEL